eukprot:TRINITY_DN1176_c0_g2_i1.p1 TRINITY_DN1176_c0_g2~~TRINITY_DN1176_c0_g2_i1.p1  ORF type:complete len:1751 (-),score=531.36 TRINITY_DN1176_c0_g2_i1:55-5307(-)
MARLTFVLSCLVLSAVLVSVDAGCEWYENCGACVADSGCGWCSNDPKGVGAGIMSSKAGSSGLDVMGEDNEGNVVDYGTNETGLPQADQLINVRGQYKKVTAVSSVAKTATLEHTYEFEGSGYLSSPYFGDTEHDNMRGKQIVGVHKTKFLDELKAGYTVKPYKRTSDGPTYTVQSVQNQFMLTTSAPISTTFDHIEFQIGHYKVDGTISYPDTSKTSLYGSWSPNPSKFTSQLKDGFVISTGSTDHSDPVSPARVAQVINDQLAILSSKFIATFENEPLWVELGGRGTGLISGTAGQSRITGSNPCEQGYPCHPETKFLKELRVNDLIEVINPSNTPHPTLTFTVNAIQDDAHLTISECLHQTVGDVDYVNGAGVNCVNDGSNVMTTASTSMLPPTTKFKIKTFHRAPYTYARAAPGKVLSTYTGDSSTAQISVSVDQISMGGDLMSLTKSIGKGYAVVVQVTAATVSTPAVYERRMVKRVTSKNTFVIDRKFSKAFNNSETGGSSLFHYESCPSLSYENYDDRVENGPGVISGSGASYTHDNTQHAEITSTDANFDINVRVGFEIVLRNTAVKRRVTKIVTNTKIYVNRPFNDYVNGAPTGFSNHAWQFVVKKGWDKNGAIVSSEGYDKKHAYGSDYHMHWKPRYNTGGSNARQQGVLSNEKQLFSHQMKSSTTTSGAGILSQDPYLLYPPVCYNNGRCVPKTSHSLVGVENLVRNSDTSARKGEIVSSSVANVVHDLVNVGDSSMFYNDCKPVCTVTAMLNGVYETRQVVGTVTAHNSTHLYTELPFTYNGTGAMSQYDNRAVPGFVPEGITAYNALTNIEFRVRYVTGTGTVHWCPFADSSISNAAGEVCDGYTLTGSSKETKTKFHSETSAQWTLTIPCSTDANAANAENKTISQVASDTKIVVHDTYTRSNNKVCYTIGNIPALGRVTNPQGHRKVYGDDDTRFLEQLKVGYTVKVNNLMRSITSITSNKEMTVNTPFTGGINTKSQMYFSGKLGTGEVSTSAGSTDVLGTLDVTQTKFNEELALGYLVMVGRDYKVVTGISSATKLEVDLPFTLMTNTLSSKMHGYYKNSFNYESCFTYEIGDYASEDDYLTKHVYVEDACEIKPGCCGFKISSVVYPDRWAYYKIRPTHSNMNIRVVATTLEDNIDLVAKKDAVPTTSSYDYTSVRESNPWALSIPAADITCGESYVGYNVSTSLGVQAHITNPTMGTSLADDTSTLDADAVGLTTDGSYAPSNCSFFYIGVRGDNRYPQKTGASEYNLVVYTEFEFPNFLCSDSGIDTSMASGAGKHACRYLGMTAVEDASFVLNTDDDRAVMRLTPNSNMRKGAMWYGTKVHLFHGFETIFEFRISHFTVGCNSVVHPSGFCGGGDGFAFVIHEELDGDKDIGCYGGALGYGTITSADQGDDWARPRCLTYASASASAKCDSGCDAINGDITGATATGNCATNMLNGVHQQDDGIFTEQCALMALCDPLDNGCGGTCGMPSCQKAISRVVSVEFDTWNNLNLHDPKQGVSRWWINATEFVGYNDNHVAIFSSDSSFGTSTDHASPNHFAATPSIPNLADGKNHTVKVKYWPQTASYSRVLKKERGAPHMTGIQTSGDCQDNTGATNSANRRDSPDACFPGKFGNTGYGNLAIFIDDMKRPVLQTKISLRMGDASGDCHDNDIDRCVLDNQGNAYIGFTASTGGERTGVTLDADGVSSTLHQSTTVDTSYALESAALKVGAAQRHEILSWKFCNKLGCVPV